MCRCGHRRSHHQYGPEDSTEIPVLPNGACMVDETGKDRCECTGFMASLATIVAAADTIADFHDALDKVIKRETECVSCVDGVFDCTCGEADEPENCADCRHPPISHGDDGCRHCDCMAGARVRIPDEPEVSDGCGMGYECRCDRACEMPTRQTLIEYAVSGGETFTAIVPPGATAMAVDGMLQLIHQDKAVLGIVRVQN